MTPPPELSYNQRHPIGASIVAKLKRALGDSILERQLSPQLLQSLTPNPARLVAIAHHNRHQPLATKSGSRSLSLPPRRNLRADVLQHQLQVYMQVADDIGRQEERFAEAAKMRRSAQTIIDEWKRFAETHPDTEADMEQKMREQAERRYRRAQDEVNREKIIAMTENLAAEKRWRIPKNVAAEVFSEPRVSCFPIAVIRGETVVKELESKPVGKVLWVRIAEGWVGAQFAFNGLLRVQLVPEAVAPDTSVRDFMLDAKDHITDNIDRSLEGCPLDKMMNFNDVRDTLTLAQRRREELRALPDGHYELIRQTWLDMQNSSTLGQTLSASAAQYDDDV